MGACNAKPKHQSVTRPTKVSPQMENKNKSVDLSWLDTSGETALAPELYTSNLTISPSLVIYFSSFYKKRMTALKSSETMLGNPLNQQAFVKRLAEINNISPETAKIWVNAYIDYMIVMSWFYFAIEEKELYAPFSIQQTHRLHLSYDNDYSNFCNILTDNKGLIHYAPRKIVLESEQIDQIEASYDEMRESIMVYVYENILIYEAASPLKEQLSEIWENFYDTFIKNEYSFYLSKGNGNKITETTIQKAISGISTFNHNFSMSSEAIRLLRKGLNLPLDPQGAASLKSLDISPLVAAGSDTTQEEKHVAKIIDEIKFPHNFARLLSWEQVISLDEAKEWIIEYKKFLFSSLRNKSTIPSENMKQVWLLHMSFTRIYKKFFEEHLKRNDLSLSINENTFRDEESTKRACVNFIDSIIKKQEELLNIKLNRTIMEVSPPQSSVDLRSQNTSSIKDESDK